MIKKISASLLLLLSLATFAQQGTSSPYSFYGIGDVRFRGTNENRAMGGLSFVPDSIHVNMQNPALLSSIKLTAFSVGGTFSPVKSKSATLSDKTQRATLDYLAVALPAKSFTVGFGLIPYSSVGYSVNNITTVNAADGIYLDEQFKGEGGVNRVYTTLSYKINSNFSIGVDLQYNFGRIETKSVTKRSDAEYGTRELNTSNVSGLGLNAGIAYQRKINKKIDFFSGLSFNPQTNLTVRNDRTLAAVQVFPAGELVVGDEVDMDVSDTKLKLPAKVSLGSGIGDLKKWFVGAEFSYQGSSDFGNRYALDNVSYENGARVNVGGFYIPKYNSFNEYWKRITYRAGFRYENTGLVINNHAINDGAVSIGFGFPLGKTFSNINIGVEMGQRGTTKSGLVQENYTNFSVGLSFNDRWFVKRKYD